MINEKLFNELKALYESKPTEAVVVSEQPSPFEEDESIRLIYLPETESFSMGHKATIEGTYDNENISPSYLENIQSVSRHVFDNEEEWLNYVTMLWTSHILNAFFMQELNPSYTIFSIIHRILQEEEEETLVADFPTGTKLYFVKDANKLELREGDKVLVDQVLPEDYDQRLATFFAFWDAMANSVHNKEEIILDEPEEEEFDLDNLYEGVKGNSENPIDASQPEIQVEDDSCPGGGCKL